MNSENPVVTLPFMAPSPAPSPLVLWGVNRHTVLAGLALKIKSGASLRIASQGVDVQRWLPGIPTIVPDEISDEMEVLASSVADPNPPVRRVSKFDLNHGTDDRLSQELRRLSIIDLHRVQQQLGLFGFEREAAFIHNFIFYRYNCRVPATAEIGQGTSLAYGGIGVVIHKDARIGRNVKIGQNVTLGARSNGHGPPVIGDDVFIGPNSVCLGGSIGSGAVVGAGSIVLKPVAAGEVVAGNPARLLRRAEQVAERPS